MLGLSLFWGILDALIGATLGHLTGLADKLRITVTDRGTICQVITPHDSIACIANSVVRVVTRVESISRIAL